MNIKQPWELLVWKCDTLFDKEKVPNSFVSRSKLLDWKFDTFCDKEHIPILECEYQIAMIAWLSEYCCVLKSAL